MKTKLRLMFLFLTITLQAQTNLVPNGNFENWTSSSQPDNWFRSFSGLVFQSTSAQNGSSSTKMQITSGTFNYINSEFFPVVAGKTYRITMYHKLVTGTFSDIELSLYHQPGTFKTEITKKTDAVTSSIEWRKIEFDYTPTVSESIEVDIWTTGTLNSEILVDNVSVVDVATLGPQYTLIPDLNFEKKLIALGYDSGTPDGKVLTSNIKAVTSLTLDAKTIADLTGIEDFVALKTLICKGNSGSPIGGNGLLTKIDVSNNSVLTTLDIGYNKIKNIDISKNLLLKSLIVSVNGMTVLDVSNNVALTNLDCSTNQLTTLDISKNVALTFLYIPYNQLTTLDLSKNVALTGLDCSWNQLTTLDVSKNLALSNLNFYQNRLTTLDVSKNIVLQSLLCMENQLTTLDISQNINLTELNCRSNLLSSLDVSKNVALLYIYCSSNKINTLDVSKNVALINFYCERNQLTTLDVSKNVALVQFNCSSNNLTSLNLKNGKNTLIDNININLTGNPNLNCIVVDVVAYANTNWATKKDATALFTSFDCSSITIIPDTKFEDKLIALGIDTDGKNGLVLNSSIAAITTLNVSNSAIADLKGIEGFTSLTTLNCSGNQLKKLDLSKNTTITTLNCSNNPTLVCIQVADLTTAASWTTTKDAIASFSLDCTIYTLIPDAKFEEKLIALGIDRDGKNGKVATESIAPVTSLSLSFSSITNLTGIQDFISLLSLECFGDNITSLDVSKNIALKYLGCRSTKLITLDLSKNVALTTFYCSSNQLTSLNLKNGKNTLITTNSINLIGNPNLKCILVDDETYANTNWSTKKDATASFNATDCAPYTVIPDGRFEDRLILLGIDTDGKNGKVKTASIESLTDLSIINAGIKDLTGIQDFKALKTLICNANELTTIDLSKNIALTELYCNNNLITTLSISQNIKLSYLACFDNQIAVLDVSKNVLLKTLSARNNKIASLDLSKNVLLETLICKDNVLSTLNLKNGKNTLLSLLDTRNNSALSCILVDNVEYAVANFRQKDATSDYSLNCTATVVYTTIPDVKFEEKLIALGIDNDGKNGKVKTTSIEYLKSINLQFSEIKDLTGIEDFKNLEVLDCAINSLTQLNVTKNLKLTELYCHFNTITSLDVSKNILLTIIQANKNSLQKFDVSTNKVLKELNLRDNQLTTLNLKNGYNANASYYISRGNPNLTCIQVDSKTYADANWSSSKDTAASYAESCNNLSTSDIVFEKLSMYPNPTSGSLFFDNVAIDKIRVYDVLGKMMNVPFKSTGNSSRANLEQLPTGIYYIYLTSNDATTVKKVMVK